MSPCCPHDVETIEGLVWVLIHSVAPAHEDNAAAVHRVGGPCRCAVLRQAYRFVFATDDEQIFAQTASLLGAIRAARSGAARDRSELASLASTLDARRYQEERLGQELNTLARSLASLEGSGSARSERIDATLRELRDTLDALID